LQVLQKEAKRSGFNFTTSVHDKLPGYVKGEGDSFRTLLDHLTQVAFKRSPDVQLNIFVVRSQADNSTILIQVRDNGPVMTEAEVNVSYRFPLSTPSLTPFQMTIEEFERGRNNANAAIPTNTASADFEDVDQDSSSAILAIGQYVRSLNGKIQVMSESTSTLLSLELAFEHKHMEDPRKLRHLFLPASRPSKTSSLSPASQHMKSIDRRSIGPPLETAWSGHQLSRATPSTNPFMVPEFAKPNHRQSRADTPSPPMRSAELHHRSSKATNSTTSSSPLEAARSIRQPSRGTPTPSPPSELARAVRRQSQKINEQAIKQAPVFWERSDSPSPPPDKALPAPPDQQTHGLNASPLGIAPLSPVPEGNSNSSKDIAVSHLTILVADNDSLAARTLDERLSQWGHSVSVVTDGQECHDLFEMKSGKIDVVFMNLKVCNLLWSIHYACSETVPILPNRMKSPTNRNQMPGVDGTLSTRMIRFLEKEQAQNKRFGSTPGSNSSSSRQRVPIVAVSASLDEEKRFDYLQAGLVNFDLF
jgi:CheY-like chemotaxis protein